MKTLLAFALYINVVVLYAADGTDTFSYYDINGNYVTIEHLNRLPGCFDTAVLKKQLHFDSITTPSAYPYRYLIDTLYVITGKQAKRYGVLIHYGVGERKKYSLFTMHVYGTPLKIKAGAEVNIITGDSGYANYIVWTEKNDDGKWRIKKLIFLSVEI